MIRRILIAVLLVLCAATPCDAWSLWGRGGVIRGRLTLPGGSTQSPAGGYDGKSRGRLMDAVIYVEQVPEKLENKLAKKAHKDQKKHKRRIVQQGLQYNPRVTVVAAGDSLQIENLDRVYHSTFSVSAARRFDLGKYPPGRITTLAFDTAGVVNLHCDIHPKMLAFVVVVPYHVFVQPDTLGRYALPKLPPGDYTLRVWHPRLGMVSRTVSVPKRGDVTLDLRL